MAHSRSTPTGRRERPADARLLPGATAAWAAAWAAPLVSLRATAITSACAVFGAAALARVPTIRRRATVAVVLVCLAAGGMVAGLRTAADHAGPVAAAARHRTEATVDLTVRTDPARRVTRVRGSELGQPPTVFAARIDHLSTAPNPSTKTNPPPRPAHPNPARSQSSQATLHGPGGPSDPSGSGDPSGPGGPSDPSDLGGAGAPSGLGGSSGTSGPSGPRGTRVRTPVTVLVTGPEAGSWLGLLPSTPIRAHGRLVPGGDGQALLLVRSAPERIGAPAAHQRFAGRLRARLRAACADLPPAARGLLPGLVVGDTSMLPADLEADFRTTELTHLTAVSGTNITILLGFVLLVLRRGGLRGRALPITGAVAVACFVVVARPEPSVLRAAAMGLVTVVALYTGRPRHGLPALAVAVLVLVPFDPTLARSYGFALSVLATGALLLLAPHWAARLCARGWPKWAAVTVAVPLAAQAVCGPLVVTFAGRVGLMAVPCNLLAEFAVAPATILGFVALVLAPVCLPLAQLAAWLGSWPIRWIVTVAHTGAALPGAAVTWPTGLFGGVALAAITVAAVPTLRVLRRPRSTRSGWPRAMTAALLATLAVVLLLRPPAVVRPLTGWPPPDWHLVMCDVGQGDAIVLNAGPGTGVLVDAGPDPHAVDRCLRDLGIRRLPLILLSHFHADHVEGLPGALRNRAVGLIQGTSVLEPMAEVTRVRRWATAAGIAMSTPTDGELRTLADLTWQTLTPLPNAPRPRPTPPPRTPTPTRPQSPPPATPTRDPVPTTARTASASPLPPEAPATHPPDPVAPPRSGASVSGLPGSPDVPVRRLALPPAGVLTSRVGDTDCGSVRPGFDVRGRASVRDLPAGSAVGGSVANNASLVVLAERHGVRMLLTGDAETEAQEALRARLAGVRVDVLKVAHHGSARQDPGLVLGLHPRLALVSVGKGNPYGHPSPSARALVAAIGARLLRTDTDGPIAVTGSPVHLNAVARGPDTPTRADRPPTRTPAQVQAIAPAPPRPRTPAGARAAPGHLPRRPRPDRPRRLRMARPRTVHRCRLGVSWSRGWSALSTNARRNPTWRRP